MGECKLNVRLLSHTMDAQRVIAMGAKICYSDKGVDELADMALNGEKLIGRLSDMGHMSPIEHASFTFAVEGVSRALLAQVTRHRIASFSVQSQRYVSMKNEDGSFGYVIPPAISALGEQAALKYAAQMETIQEWYNGWVEALGEAGEKSNEDARFVLPNAAETRFVMTMNARELIHFFSLRCCNRAQWEIRELAWRMLELVYGVAPAVFKNAGPCCLKGDCPEGKMSCKNPAYARNRKDGIVNG